tara:strand:+ start:105 stop:368 length:264 start_codon:yes stop_codon:yes gene_type:complete
MWKKIKDKRDENGHNLCYYYDNFLIIEIYDCRREGSSIISSTNFVSLVTSYPFGQDGDMLHENDLEVLKLKSLLYAKSIGWDIKTIT